MDASSKIRILLARDECQRSGHLAGDSKDMPLKVGLNRDQNTMEIRNPLKCQSKKIHNVSKEWNVQDMILKGFTDSFEFHLLIDFETRSY